MNDSIIGQIDFFAFGFTPKGYLPCDGRPVLIDSYKALYSLISNTYGGGGKVDFCLPDLRGCVPVGLGVRVGQSEKWALNTRKGTETVTLTMSQYPAHNHGFSASTTSANASVAGGNFAGFSPSLYGAVPATVKPDIVNKTMLGASNGNSQAHNNMQPYLVLEACICCEGIPPVFDELASC